MFTDMLNDRVSLVKADGRRYDNLPAAVSSGKIITLDSTIPIDDGDEFQRRWPSGTVERYEVIDAGFHNTFHGMEAHYQSKVKKRTATGMAPF